MQMKLACPAYAITINITEKRIPDTMHSPLSIIPNIDRAVKATPDALEILTYVFLFILRKPLSGACDGLAKGNKFDAGKRAEDSADSLSVFLSSSAEIFRVPMETSFSTKK